MLVLCHPLSHPPPPHPPPHPPPPPGTLDDVITTELTHGIGKDEIPADVITTVAILVPGVV